MRHRRMWEFVAACVFVSGCSADLTGPDRPPVARAGFDMLVDVDQKVVLDGSSSWDPDGDSIDFKWRLLSAPLTSSARLQQGPTENLTLSQAAFVPDTQGTFVAGLVVSSNGLDSRMDVVRLQAGTQSCASDEQCDDGLYCNGAEHCVDSVCQSGIPIDCSSMDGVCIKGVCNEDDDSCETSPVDEGTTCEDGLFCTVGETCDGQGNCKGGSPRDCSVGAGSCTDGTCNEDDDACETSPVDGGTPCEDGLFCTVGETCDGQGNCKGGSPRDCSVGAGSCTDGTCNEDTDSCEGENVADNTPCDDGKSCTTGDRCRNGECIPTGGIDCSALDDDCNTGTCTEPNALCVANPSNEDGACDDGLTCTTVDRCKNGLCAGIEQVDCSSLDDQCNKGVCSEPDGTCGLQPINEGLSCEDGLFCKVDEVCASGVCIGQDMVCPQSLDPCKTSVCDEESDQCETNNEPDTTPCDDQNGCTQNDQCTAGVCNGTDTCSLGCNDAADRCYEIAPSNVDAQYLCASEQPDMEVHNGHTALLDTGEGTLEIDGSLLATVNAYVSQTPPMPQIAVFSLGSIYIEDGAEMYIFGSRAAALLVCGDVTIDGYIYADGDLKWAGPGGFDGGDGNDGVDTPAQPGDGPQGSSGGPGTRYGGNHDYRQSAGGGGGYGMSGGRGGQTSGPGNDDYWGGDGGVAFGADTIMPLVGGAGGGGGASWNQGGDGGGGGGGLQITAAGEIHIGPDGAIDVSGGGGGVSSIGNYGAGGGGGAGGGLILEAVSVSIDGTLAANGGGGGGGRTDYPPYDYDCPNNTPQKGEEGPVGNWQAGGGVECDADDGAPNAGAGGNGGATFGTNGLGEQGHTGRASGGGGGAMGRIRINTFEDSNFSNFGITSPECGDTGGEPTSCTTGAVNLR